LISSLAKETLEPLSQAAWLLQVKKTTDSDAEEIYERCSSLSAVQVTGLPSGSLDLWGQILITDMAFPALASRGCPCLY
jgi:hypothetical protein